MERERERERGRPEVALLALQRPHTVYVDRGGERRESLAGDGTVSSGYGAGRERSGPFDMLTKILKGDTGDKETGKILWFFVKCDIQEEKDVTSLKAGKM